MQIFKEEDIKNLIENFVNSFTIYMVVTRTPKHLYIGSTENIERRIIQHSTGKGAKFLKEHGVKKVIVIEKTNTLEKALSIEAGWSKKLRNMSSFVVSGGGYNARRL